MAVAASGFPRNLDARFHCTASAGARKSLKSTLFSKPLAFGANLRHLRERKEFLGDWDGYRRSGAEMIRRFTPLLALALAACSAPPPPASAPPQSRPDLAGMWSDPPRTALDAFCFMACTEAGLKHLAALLDDPANDVKPYGDLAREALQHQTNDYMRPHMTEAGLATWPLDPFADRGYLYCEPWGVVRQAFAPRRNHERRAACFRQQAKKWSASSTAPG